MTVYQSYTNGEFHPLTTRLAVLRACEIYEEFLKIRKENKYEVSILLTAKKVCSSKSKVKKAITLAKCSIKN